MALSTPAETRRAADVVRDEPVLQAGNGICYAAAGETAVPSGELERLVGAVPRVIAAALERKAFYFVPLAIAEGEETVVSTRYDVDLSDRAICHRNVTLGNSHCVFISTRLMDDRFAVAFEFYINVAHAFVDKAGVSEEFSEVVWKQAEAGVKGETSIDAFELRRKTGAAVGAVDEKAKSEYLETAFSDAIAVYMLSLYIDLDYYDLREREYPLLAAPALAERLRKVNQLFPPNSGYDFAIYYRRSRG
jgi:hypothetical protein